MLTTATKWLRRARGGSQGHFLETTDGIYLCKMLGNPQCDRVLANELLCNRLAAAIGLTVPESAIVEIPHDLIRDTAELRFSLADRTIMPTAGPAFGSRLVEGEKCLDYLPPYQLSEVSNAKEFAGILAFDKWTCNADGRQFVFAQKRRSRRMKMWSIDFGYAFNAGEWSWPDAPLRGIFSWADAYHSVAGWESFEPWLSRIENFPAERLFHMAADIPTEWYGERHELDALLLTLHERRNMVRHLITVFRHCSRAPFPNWLEHGPTAATGQLSLMPA